MGRPDFVLKYRINDNEHERPYGNMINNNDALLDKLVLQSNFEFYDNHEFPNLS